MKPNVDLTMNRDFADRNANRGVNRNTPIAFGSIVASINSMIHGKHPRIPWIDSGWLEISDDNAFRNGESSNLIFMGNKEERAKKKFYDSEYDDTICYCCGAKIAVPWKNRFRVCPKCESVERGDKVPWRE